MLGRKRRVGQGGGGGAEHCLRSIVHGSPLLLFKVETRVSQLEAEDEDSCLEEKV